MKTIRNPIGRRATCIPVVWLMLLAAFPPAAPAATPLAALSASLRAPTRVAVDGAGNFLMVESAKGQIVTLDSFGRAVGVQSGFAAPVAVAVDSAGNKYVAEQGSGGVSLYDAQWNFLRKLGGGDREFLLPNYLAVESAPGSGRVYVCDGAANQIRAYTNGAFAFSFGTLGTASGQFNFPAGVWLGASGELFVVDQGNDRLQVFDRSGGYLRKFALGSGGMFGAPSGRSQGIAGDRQGRVYVADTFQGIIKVFGTNGTALGTIGGYGDGPGQFRLPSDAAIDPLGRLAVASANNGRVELFGLDDYLHVGVSPATRITPVGTDVVFSAVAGGSGPFTFQWRKGTNNLVDARNISGATSPTLTLLGVAGADSGPYSVVVTGPSSTLMSPSSDLLVMAAPGIMLEPSSQTVFAGTGAQLQVVAVGDALAYQWSRNGLDIPGAAGRTLNLPNVQPEDTGLYAVTVRNALGSVTSQIAALNVILPPSPPQIDAFSRLPGGEYYLRFGAEVGLTYGLESSTNLLEWGSVTNLVSDTGIIEVLLPLDSNQPQQYFRVMWIP